MRCIFDLNTLDPGIGRDDDEGHIRGFLVYLEVKVTWQQKT